MAPTTNPRYPAQAIEAHVTASSANVGTKSPALRGGHDRHDKTPMGEGTVQSGPKDLLLPTITQPLYPLTTHVSESEIMAEEAYAPAYTPVTSRNWVEYLEEAKVSETELNEDACQMIAKGFSEIGWDPSVEELKAFRREFEPLWKSALIDHWKASRVDLTMMLAALRGKNKPVGSMLRSMTENVIKDQIAENPPRDSDRNPGRSRQQVKVPRVRIPIESDVWKNYARCHVNTNLTKIPTAEPEQLKEAIECSGLKNLLQVTLEVTDQFAGHFTSQEEPGQHLGDTCHREEWTEFQSRAKGLRDVIADLLPKDHVELIMEKEQGIEELHQAALEAFVATAAYFGHFEARHLIGWHQTTTGKIKGVMIARLRENLKRLEGLTARTMAAGQIIAAMGNNKKEKRMRVLETCAVWAVMEVPALMTPFTENIMWHFAGAGAHSSTLGCRPPRNPYANPPSEARYYGKIDAPLAGVMDKTTTLDAQLDTITQDWAAKRGGKALAAINACTTVVLSLNELPRLRDNENTEKCYRIPRSERRSLTQSLFEGAGAYVEAARRAGDQDLEHLEAEQELREEVDRLVRAGQDSNAREFLTWVTRKGEGGWNGEGGRHECPICRGIVTVAADKPIKAFLHHLDQRHSKEHRSAFSVKNTPQGYKGRQQASEREIIPYGLSVEEEQPRTSHSKARRSHSSSTGRECDDWEDGPRSHREYDGWTDAPRKGHGNRAGEPRGYRENDRHQSKKAKTDRHMKSQARRKGPYRP